VAWRMPVFILVIALAVLGTIGGSYIIYLKEKKKNDNQ